MEETAIHSTLSIFYKYLIQLPHIDSSALVYLSSGNAAWPNVNSRELRKRGKTEQVITLLRYLPYLRHSESSDPDSPSKKKCMIAPDTVAIAYCDGEVYSAELDTIQPTPAHCIWLADATSTKDGTALLLDTESNTITEYAVRSDRTIGLSAEEYSSLPRADRWMAHVSWPVDELFGLWMKKYKSLEWMPVHHDRGAAGTTMWFISPPPLPGGRVEANLEDEEGEEGEEDEDSDESYEPSSSEESDDDYDSEEDDPYEWDSEYDSEDEDEHSYELSSEEGKTGTETDSDEAEENEVSVGHVTSNRPWLNYFDAQFQVRLVDGESLGAAMDAMVKKAVEDASEIYKRNGWPDALDREQCQSQLSELVDQVIKSAGD